MRSTRQHDSAERGRRRRDGRDRDELEKERIGRARLSSLARGPRRTISRDGSTSSSSIAIPPVATRTSTRGSASARPALIRRGRGLSAKWLSPATPPLLSPRWLGPRTSSPSSRRPTGAKGVWASMRVAVEGIERSCSPRVSLLLAARSSASPPSSASSRSVVSQRGPDPRNRCLIMSLTNGFRDTRAPVRVQERFGPVAKAAEPPTSPLAATSLEEASVPAPPSERPETSASSETKADDDAWQRTLQVRWAVVGRSSRLRLADSPPTRPFPRDAGPSDGLPDRLRVPC